MVLVMVISMKNEDDVGAIGMKASNGDHVDDDDDKN